MENTKELSKERKEQALESIRQMYVINTQGTMFQIVPGGKDPERCFLRNHNKKIKTTYTSIRQNVVDGHFRHPNEHEIRKWVAQDNAYFDNLARLLLKRMILSQLLIELDDELVEHYENDKYLRNQLEKTQKQCTRVTSNLFDQVFKVDEQNIHKLFNHIGGMVHKLAQTDINDLMIIDGYLDEKLNPEMKKV